VRPGGRRQSADGQRGDGECGARADGHPSPYPGGEGGIDCVFVPNHVSCALDASSGERFTD
jgi:hypothetical protein